MSKRFFFKQSSDYFRFPVCHFNQRDIQASYDKWVDRSILTFARWGLKVNLDSCSFRGVCAIAVSGVSGTVISWNDKKRMVREKWLKNELTNCRLTNQRVNPRMYTEIFEILRLLFFNISESFSFLVFIKFVTCISFNNIWSKLRKIILSLFILSYKHSFK